MSRTAVAAEWAKGFSKIVAQQKALASAPPGVFVHRKGGDFITSRVIPLALTAAGTALLLPGMFHLITGTGKLE